MKNILITGAVLGATKESIAFYQTLIAKLKGKDVAILSPLDTMKLNGTDIERFERAKKSVEDADVIIAEISSPSYEQGMELMLAKILQKECVFSSRIDTKTSGLIKGAFPNSTFIFYDEKLTYKQFKSIKEIISKSNFLS